MSNNENSSVSHPRGRLVSHQPTNPLGFSGSHGEFVRLLEQAWRGDDHTTIVQVGDAVAVNVMVGDHTSTHVAAGRLHTGMIVGALLREPDGSGMIRG
jgi:hypothetical protein